MNDAIREAVSKVTNIEFLDLDSFKLSLEFSPQVNFCLTCNFDGFVLSLRNLQPQKAGFDLVAELEDKLDAQQSWKTSAAFTIGYNPKTEKPQLGWHDEHPPENVDLRVAVDVVIGCLFAAMRTVPNLWEHMEHLFPTARPLSVVK